MDIMERVFSFKDISVAYQSQLLFQNVSFDVMRGQKVVISGRSGIGKTTVLSLILGYMRPKKGAVWFCGLEVDERAVWSVRQKISYVNQDVTIGTGKVSDLLRQYFSLRANKHIAYNAEKAYDLLHYFELSKDILNKHIEALSGGERQRVALIISILLGRSIFLLDEATAFLDPALKEKTVSLFLSNPEWTLLVVSHDMAWQEDHNAKIYNLEEGQWQR